MKTFSMRALTNGTIAGAGLDVHTIEPLPHAGQVRRAAQM